MRNRSQVLSKLTGCILFCLSSIVCNAQTTLKLTDFAVWGGSASASSYTSLQGVFIKEKGKITGNIGSNHLVDIKEFFTLTGSIYSGNAVSLKNTALINGNITANKTASNFSGTVITGDYKSDFKGNLIARGKISITKGSGSTASFVRGQVAVPAPSSTNYSGPIPGGGITNTVVLPILPSMPSNTTFDSKIGTAIVNNTATITPGLFKKMSLPGNKTITFKGPGNYIFYEIDNGSNTNKFIFDFTGASTGSINIFIIRDGRMGKLSVSIKNGDPSRIFTEVHGQGSSGGGFSLELQSPDVMPASSYVWLGNVWAPNGGITVKNLKTSTTPHIIGALWSAKQVELKENCFLSYQAPSNGPSFVTPYYPPPVDGKVPANNNVIGAELYSLTQNTTPISSIPDNEIFEISANKVLIEVVSKDPSDGTLRTQLINLGMTNASGVAGTIDNGPHIYTISGYFPIANLSQLNGNTRIEYVRPLYPPLSNAGLITTQGDTTMRSHNVKGRFGLDGTGVKVGVISDSYNSNATAAALDVTQGELPGTQATGPGPVQILHPEFQITGSDEGRAMLQIVHDVAPKAKLAFRTGFLTAGDFARGIKELSSSTLDGGRCDVIVDDITYITEPFLRDGFVAQTVNQVVKDSNVTYFSAAGNFGKQSYEAVFNGVTNRAAIATGQLHQFGTDTTKVYQSVNLKPGSYTIVLQWSDEFSSLGSVTGVQTDLDLYVVGINGFTLFGFNRSNLLGDPFEVCPFTVSEETNAKLMIVRAAGSNNVRFKYIIFRGDATIVDYNTSGNATLVGHPNADSAIAVGAMLYANFPQFTPIWPSVASFSSKGGTFTLKNDGSNTYTQRNKPELVGPNGVNTSVNLRGAVLNDGDNFPNFFGTSAAAPHVAGVAALLIQGRKKYNLQSSVKPFEIRQQLQTSAGKFAGQTGFSYDGGYGYVQADSAVQQIANGKPILTSLEAVVPGSQNGALPFQVKIKGQYLTPFTQIYFGSYPNGILVPTTVSADKTEAVGTVPAIPPGQNPPFQLLNAAKSPSGLDGGLSDSLYFFGSRAVVTVRVQDQRRKYGIDNAAFTADIRINNVPIGQTSTSLASLKLDNLVYTTAATRTSPAGLNYAITADRAVALPVDDPLYSQYIFNFAPGALTIDKMPLKITPVAKQIKYGEDPGEIDFIYQLDPSVPQNSSLFAEVKDMHKQFLADNAVVAIKDFNGQTSSLNNMAVMASYQSLRNARRFLPQNGQLTAMSGPIDETQIGAQRFVVDISNQSLANYLASPGSSAMLSPVVSPHGRAFINLKSLINGTAKSAIPNGQLQPLVNGQLIAMVNGQLKAIVNGQLQPLVNGQLMPLVNGQLVAMVNGQLKALVNGQLLALVNGQLMMDDNGDVQIVQDLSISNGQLKALVNGQLKAIVNGQLKAIVNGIYTDVSFLNGQLKAIVNGVTTDLSYINGQLKAIVNGQLKAIVNGAEVGVESPSAATSTTRVKLSTDNTYVPIKNGQLQAMVNATADPANSQLLSMVNGQLMAIVNNELTFVVYQNGQLKALVNGQLEPQANLLTNGQLKAIVNGQLQTINATVQTNGQLKAIVNGEDWTYANGQLKAIVNGQLKALVNNFDVTGTNNNANTIVVVDEDDINLQYGDLGGMFSVNMITGLSSGSQKLVPGAFVSENFEVTYGLGDITILPALHVTGNNVSKKEGEANPPLTLDVGGLVNGDDVNTLCSVSGNPSYNVPTPPIAISQLFRTTVYTNVSLNSGANAITVQPGAAVNLSGDWSSSSQADGSLPGDPQCVGCYTQHYIGISDVFTLAFDANGSAGHFNVNFKAPKNPGVYYISQTADWQYNPYDGRSGDADNNPASAIAVVVVSGNKPFAVTTAKSYSPVGNYPIDISGCTDFTNYGLVYTPGTLTVEPYTCLQQYWNADGIFTDVANGYVGTPNGIVTATGLGKVGAPGTWNGLYSQNNSFSFSGSGYIELPPAASVQGTEDFTVSAWVRTTSNEPMVVINQRGADNNGFGSGFNGEYYLKIGGDQYAGTQNVNAGKAYFLVYDMTNNISEHAVFSSSLVNDGNWHFIKGERIGTTINLYVDGVLEATTTTAGVVNFDAAIPTYIGADVRDNGSFFNGLIDEIRVTICPGTSNKPGRNSIAPVTKTGVGLRETKLFPNPASTTVRVMLTDDVKTAGDIRVFDVLGRLTNLNVRKLNEGIYELNVSRLRQGIYFINAKTSAGTKSFRFIKL